VKKCASCTKDLPEAALHCVFCGAKQPPAPAVQPGLAKTAFGYSNEMMEQLKQSGGQAPRPQPGSQPPPSYAPPQQQGYPPPQQQGYPPPQQGYPPPQQQSFAPIAPSNAATVFVQGGPPPMQPPQGNYNMPTARHPPSQPPPQGMGGYNPVPVQQPQMGGMGVHSPQQFTPQPLPNVQQPYGQQGMQHGGRPVEPWKDALPFMMIVWGVALLVAFATPMSTDPLAFSWDAIIHGEGTAKVPFLVLAAVGLLGVVIGAIPMLPMPRGILAAILGLAGILVPIFLIGMPPWQILLPLVGLITLIPGLLVRNEYTESMFARALVTVGVICTLVPLLIPSHGEIPLVNLFKALIDAPGEHKVKPILEIGMIVIVVMSLLVWMPGPATGGAKVFAWLIILYPVAAYFVNMLIAGHVVDVIKASPQALVSWVDGATCSVFVGYGLATVFGKQLE
jgi:hypothetical protein